MTKNHGRLHTSEWDNISMAVFHRLSRCLSSLTLQMAVFDERSGNLYVTELGRVASHYYIRSGSEY